MTIEMYIRAQMARFAIEEGQRHGGVNNMLAILHVLRNRVMAGWGDWQEVVERAPRSRATIYAAAEVNLRSNDVRLVLNRVEDIYLRIDVNDLTGGALWYVDQNFPIEDWFKSQILEHSDDHRRVAHIGPVWFFT